MDTFFQKLRDIQKKERSTGSLSRIDDTFYDDASCYLQELLKEVDKSPLSLEAYQLRDAQRITIEIRERREFKIIQSAITNVQKSHNLFKGHEQDSTLYEEVPINLTPEEERFYKAIVDVMVDNRQGLLSEIRSTRGSQNKIGFKPKEAESKPEKEVSSKKIPDEKSIDNKASSQDNKASKKRPKKEEDQSRNLGSTIDEDQITLMFGQAPDDLLRDEDNNPVKLKDKKTDIKTPFKKPEVPKEDTITLQNNDEYHRRDVKQKESGAQEVTTNLSDNKDMQSSQENPQDTHTTHSIKDTQESNDQIPNKEDNQDHQEYNQEDQKLDRRVDDDTSKDTASQEVDIDEDALVEFCKKVSTDILDENLNSYGPFEKRDMVILPSSLINILLSRNIIKLL